jgi:magnesium-transporting ATPase (P-type)
MIMEELDLLKKDWQKKDAFEQVSEGEIYKMLHMKSSSIVKWIFMISIFELGLGLFLGLLISFTKYDEQSTLELEKMGIYNYYILSSVIMYAVVLFFIYKFYSIYRKISVDDNAKQLILNILKTRKVVKQYIAFNLTSFAVLVIALGGYGIYRGYIDTAIKNGDIHPEMPLGIALISILILVLATAFFTFIFWLFYKLLYGILLKRLHKNYEELKKIDL